MIQRRTQAAKDFRPWPDPPTEEFLATLKPDHDLLACWERWLYTQHLDAYEGREGKPAQGWIPEWGQLLKDFARTLSHSDALRQICVTQCRDGQAAHDLLLLVFACFGLPAPHKRKQKDRAPIEARGLQRRLNQLDKIVGCLSPFYVLDTERAELSRILNTWRERARLQYDPATKQRDPGPSALIVAPDAPTPAKQGHPKLSGRANNIYSSRVRALVRQAYDGRNPDKMTVAVIREFNPGSLGIGETYEQGPNYPEKKFGARLGAFAKAVNPAPTRQCKTDESAPPAWVQPLRDLFPLPPCAASASYSVLDRTR